MKRGGDSTHHCRSPTPTLNGCDLTPSTWSQSFEQEYSYLTASKRHPSTPYSHIIPQSFSWGTQPYAFPRSTKHVHTSLACSQDFWKICWGVGLWSIVLRPRWKPHWVLSSFGSNTFATSWHTLFLGNFVKRCRGSWFIHPCLPLCMGMFNLPIFRCPSKTPCHLTHSAKPSGVLSSPNSLSNFSQLAFGLDLAAASESLLMHSSTEAFICAKLKHLAWKTLLSSVRWSANVDKRKQHV